MRSWIEAVTVLRNERRPGVLATVIAVRGHAPREAGAKMVISSQEIFGTIGGGNLEMAVMERARQMIAVGEGQPQSISMKLSDKAPAKFGRQCCGGEVTVLLEPLPVVATVAIFGVGNVGMELARILSRHDLELHLVDSRPEFLEELPVLEPSVAQIHPAVAVLGEQVLSALPDGAHVLIMTHDHAEDFHLCDAALRHPGLGSIGLIGSSAKWARFQKNLGAGGFSDQQIAAIQCPIGIEQVRGKQPAVIAVSVAAELLARITDAATQPVPDAEPAQNPEPARSEAKMRIV
ncbi:xanthine dehydrogenase accessory protein XdhC [Glutamicibacter nicotianae]|uniref:xanthine dehydrogenase accessory protein XdhC n=1 Tax=Glutamicibacter nicotianae TaxID=37929 RepID=UPI00195B4C41|nr:xanthine dehydrogenase accessory protein XdhC [Glutamicibacter nicotianae]MBM7769645.1 xanthine dehydrogenase accessory factor [Glutamicibacter nicotianae]